MKSLGLRKFCVPHSGSKKYTSQLFFVSPLTWFPFLSLLTSIYLTPAWQYYSNHFDSWVKLHLLSSLFWPWHQVLQSSLFLKVPKYSHVENLISKLAINYNQVINVLIFTCIPEACLSSSLVHLKTAFWFTTVNPLSRHISGHTFLMKWVHDENIIRRELFRLPNHP